MTAVIETVNNRFWTVRKQENFNRARSFLTLKFLSTKYKRGQKAAVYLIDLRDEVIFWDKVAKKGKSVFPVWARSSLC
jgi:hypothetical protein